MRVLVTGSTGFVGGATCEVLTARGHEVLGAARMGRRDRPAASIRFEERNLGDLAVRRDFSELVAEVEGVVHTAARVHVTHRSNVDEELYHRVNVQATQSLAAAAALAGVRRFVFISTVKVHGETSSDQPIRELDPFHPTDPYARSKLQAESVLTSVAADSDMQLVIVRPSLVYGPGVRANFLRLMEAVSRGLPLPLARTTSRRSMIFVSNLAALLERCLVSTEASGETFLAADDSLTPAELVRQLAAALGVRPRLLAVPVPVVRLIGRLGDVVRPAIPFPMGSAEVGRLFDPLEVDSSKTNTLLGFRPPISREEGLRRTAAWFHDRQATS